MGQEGWFKAKKFVKFCWRFRSPFAGDVLSVWNEQLSADTPSAVNYILGVRFVPKVGKWRRKKWILCSEHVIRKKASAQASRASYSPV